MKTLKAMRMSQQNIVFTCVVSQEEMPGCMLGARQGIDTGDTEQQKFVIWLLRMKIIRIRYLEWEEHNRSHDCNTFIPHHSTNNNNGNTRVNV